MDYLETGAERPARGPAIAALVLLVALAGTGAAVRLHRTSRAAPAATAAPTVAAVSDPTGAPTPLPSGGLSVAAGVDVDGPTAAALRALVAEAPTLVSPVRVIVERPPVMYDLWGGAYDSVVTIPAPVVTQAPYPHAAETLAFEGVVDLAYQTYVLPDPGRTRDLTAAYEALPGAAAAALWIEGYTGRPVSDTFDNRNAERMYVSALVVARYFPAAFHGRVTALGRHDRAALTGYLRQVVGTFGDRRDALLRVVPALAELAR
jgi:hypothetical protein